MRSPSALLAVAVLAAACGGAPASTSPAPVSSGAITAAELHRDLYAFAADSFRGRETGTPDAFMAALFIVHRLESLGLEPAGDSGFFQRVPLVRDVLAPDTRFTVSAGGTSTALRLGADVAPLTFLGPGAPEPKRSASGDVLFGGYGVTSAPLGRDDWAALAALDPRGKTIVLIHGAPANADSTTRAQLTGQPALSMRIGRALQLQPAAIVILMAGPTEDLFRQAMPELTRGVSAGGRPEAASDADRPFPMIVLGLASAGSPLLPAGWPADDKPQALAGRHFTGVVDLRHEPFTAYNVVAKVSGTDPQLRETYVAFGAHYDHIGIQPPLDGDSIANGADDDGSGSMALLAVAARMKASPTRRSALFVWHVGEEKGLLGSTYFTAHATVPIDSIVAQINADMIGRNAPESLYVVGPLAAPNHQSAVLGGILDSVNAASAHPFVFNREWDSPTHPEHIYERSDHYNYAKRGIPIVFLTTGLHADYHKVTDDPSKIDYDKMAHVSELLLDVGRAVGNRPSRPIARQ